MTSFDEFSVVLLSVTAGWLHLSVRALLHSFENCFPELRVTKGRNPSRTFQALQSSHFLVGRRVSQEQASHFKIVQIWDISI